MSSFPLASLALFASISLLAPACVSQSRYDQAVRDAQAAHVEAQRAQSDERALRTAQERAEGLTERQKRRTEITLQPNIDEPVSIPPQ